MRLSTLLPAVILLFACSVSSEGPAAPAGPGVLAVTIAGIDAPSGSTFEGTAITATADEIAVLVSRRSGVGNTIELQRFSSDGRPRAEAMTLDAPATIPQGGLTITTDGMRYVACWEANPDVACASIPLAGGPATKLPRHDGARRPSLAYSAGTWALVYLRRADGAVVVAHVADDGTATTALEFDGECDAGGCSASSGGASTIVAATNGFLVLGGVSTVKAHWLDGALAPTSPAIDLGARLSYESAAAVGGDLGVVSVSQPYTVTVVVFDHTRVTKTYEPKGRVYAGKAGMSIGLAFDGKGFATLWHGTADRAYRYATLDEAFTRDDFAETYALALVRMGDGAVSARIEEDRTHVVIARAP